MKFLLTLLASGLVSGVMAQTTPATNAPTTTRSTNNVGFGGTVNSTPTSTNAATGSAPARYDDRNSGLPAGEVKMKGDKATKMKTHKTKMK